jgi:hypothetical protein
VLLIADLTKPYTLMTNASKGVIAGILTQNVEKIKTERSKGDERVVAYAS